MLFSSQAAVAQCGRLDIAFNNAGVADAMGSVVDLAADQWDRLLAINLNGVFYGMKYQIPEMQKVGGGAIINTASIAGLAGCATGAAYVASKHAVIGLTKCTAIDFAKDNIRVNALAPGLVQTPILASTGFGQEMIEAMAKSNVQQRIADPEELVPTIMLFSSNQLSSYQTGSTFVIDGGHTIKF
jgi:NAD(P)-dependent dehydrogenase (short-subunit alcohol dehydrogenase family)